MVETRRSDEPLVETVEPEMMARRGRAAHGGEVPARGGRKASPRRASPTRHRNSSSFERMLAKDGMSYATLMSALGALAMLVAVFTPVPAADFVFVAAVCAYAALATALRFPRRARVEQPGPYPFRPIAAPPIHGFVDQHQMLSLMTGVVAPVSLILASRFWHIKFASDALREAVASQLFLQLCQYLVEALGQWPARLAPPVWLTLPAMFGAARMRSLLGMFAACRADALFPRIGNSLGFAGIKWLFRRHSGAELMLTATRLAAMGGLAATLIDCLIALPLIEAPAFMDARYVGHKPSLHEALEPGVGRERTAKAD